MVQRPFEFHWHKPEHRIAAIAATNTPRQLNPWTSNPGNSVGTQHSTTALPFDLKREFRMRHATKSFMLVSLISISITFYYAITLGSPLGLNDEGLMLYGASRISDGYVPYRDTWMTGYSPGQFYMLAGLFKSLRAGHENILTIKKHSTIMKEKDRTCNE
jgi:hypothetical protein